MTLAVTRKIMNKFLIVSLLILCFVPLVHADIISINDGGTAEYVINSGEIVENFFFGQSSSGTTTQDQQGSSLNNPFQLDSFCNYSRYFILEHRKDNNLSYSEYELNTFSQLVSNQLNISLNPDAVQRTLKTCSDKIVTKNRWWIWLVIPIIVLFLTLVIYKSVGFYKEEVKKLPNRNEKSQSKQT